MFYYASRMLLPVRDACLVFQPQSCCLPRQSGQSPRPLLPYQNPLKGTQPELFRYVPLFLKILWVLLSGGLILDTKAMDFHWG